MSRFARRNLADKSDSDESETKLVDDLEMAMLEKEQSSPVEETTRPESSKSGRSETIVLVDKLETSIKKMFDSNPSFWADYDVNIERPPLLLEESPLFRPLFRPLLIAMGPHHRTLANTKQLENHKLSALQAVFGVDKVRAELFGVDNVVSLRDNLYKLIEDTEEKARRCYEREVHLSKEEFVKILLLDSVFILTMIILDSRGGFRKFDQEWVWGIEPLLPDLLLMENQIPFFVLEDMWNAIKEKIVINEDIKGLSIINLFKRTPFWDEDSSDFDEEEEPDSLLGLYYLWNVPISVRVSTRPRSQQQSSESWFQSCIARLWPKGRKQRNNSAIPSATELHEAGLIFTENEWYTNMFDITFEDGVLEIPTLTIDSENMSRITNLLCHENNNSYKESTVASYVFLMDSLINTKEDIALLQKFGIINNKLASDEEAAAFINSLGEHCDEGESNNFYDPVIADVLDFTKSGWRRNWTSLKHNYFSNPWTGISLIAAIFLLFLSCVQTYYAVFPRK